MSSQLKLGSKVSFLRDTGSGTIVEINEIDCLVEDEHGFETWYNIDELVPFMNVSEEKLFSAKNSLDKLNQDSKAKKAPSSKSAVEWRIDLHIENLIDSTRGMTNHAIVTMQIDHFKSFLKKAERAKAHRLIVIHGKGTGKLKGEILHIVRGIKGAEMHDADIRQGSSIIERKYNVR